MMVGGWRVAGWTFLGYYSYQFSVSPCFSFRHSGFVSRSFLFVVLPEPSHVSQQRETGETVTLVKYLRTIYEPGILLMINSMVTDFSFSHLEKLARTDEKEKDR